MIKKSLLFYRIPLLISITLAIVLIALKVIRDPFGIAMVVVGSVFGSFALDLDYFVYAYFIEPKKDFSRTLSTFVKHRDFGNALVYVNTHKNDIEEKTLDSAIFQIVLVFLGIFVIFSNVSYFIKIAVLSTYANSIYRLVEAYFHNRTDSWFWALKDKPTKKGTVVYLIVLVIIFLYCVSAL